MSNINDTLDPSLKNYKIKVLLVDDQAIVGEQVRRMLLDQDIEFHFCKDSANAVSTAIEISPTIILQDLVMPDIDGMTLVRYYRAHPKLKEIPVIVLSSKEEAETKAELFAKGANDYLVKLPDKIELIARIKYHSTAYINLLQRNAAFRLIESELKKAGEYVESMLPKTINNDMIETFYRFIPSAQLGGDLFGYHHIDENHFAIYLLDVCGHGVGSALLSVSAHNILRGMNLADTDFTDPENVAISLNEKFQMSDHHDLYFTLFYSVYNKQTRTFEYINAGHPPALMVNNSNYHQLENENFIIGGLPFYPFSKSKCQIEANSCLYIYSDGSYEIDKTDGEMWTLEEMHKFIFDNNNSEHTELDLLYEECKKISAKKILDDDYSILKIIFK